MNIQPDRCSAPARCTLTPERGQALHSHPTPRALCPHLGVRGGHRRALTWHLLLSVQVVAVFIWVFKQVSGKKEAKKKKKSNYANGLRPGRRALDLMLLLYEFLEQPDPADLWGRVTATPGPAAGASRS